MTRLQERLQRGPDDAGAVVCVDGENSLSWGDLAGRSARVAEALRAAPCDDPVLGTHDPFDFLAALLACWHLGTTPIVPPNLQPATLAQFARNRILLDEPWFAAVATGRGGAWSAPAANAALTLYTSGSSGDAKAIPKSLAQLAAEVDVLETVWGARLGDATLLATVPHHHLYGLLFRLMLPLATGRRFDRGTCLDADDLLAAVRRHPRHVLISSPSHLVRLPQLTTFERWTPRPLALFSSGAPLDGATAQLYRRECGEAPIEVLGSTESGGIARRQRNDGDDDRWTPLPSVTVERTGDGALVVSSPWSGGPCRLEDEVDVSPDGRFRLGARMDRIVKLEGKRVSLPEVEAQMATHAWVAAAAAELAPSGVRLGAVLVLSDAGREARAHGGRARIAQAMREHLRGRIERVAVPRRFRIVERLPLSERGKIDRMALRTLLADDDEPVA